jgi:hypothetical protein
MNEMLKELTGLLRDLRVLIRIVIEQERDE